VAEDRSWAPRKGNTIMAWRTVVIDESITHFRTGEGLIHVQEGPYLVQLVAVEPSPKDLDYTGERGGEPRKPYVAGVFEIQDGAEGVGKKLRNSCIIEPMKADGQGGAWGLGTMIHALGGDPAQFVNQTLDSWEKLDALAKLLTMFLTKRVATKGATGVEVSDGSITGRDGKARPVSNITGWFPADEWEKRKLNISRPPSYPTPPTPVSNGSPSSSSQTAPPAAGSPPTTPAAGSGPDDMEALVAAIMGQTES
jgi:hypothetical protein